MFSLRLATVLGVLLLVLGSVPQAYAKTFVVTSTADTDGAVCGTDCTLRQAINASNKDHADANTIVFDKAVFATKRTIEVTGHNDSGPNYNGLPAVFGDVSILGPSDPGSGVTIRADKADSTLLQTGCFFDRPHDVNISNLTVSGAGMGFRNSGSRVRITNCTFSHNVTGIYNFTLRYTYASTGALCRIVPATLTVNNSTFADNREVGIYNQSGTTSLNFCTVTKGKKGVVGVNGAIIVSNSILAGNTEDGLWGYDSCTFTKFGRNITQGTREDAGLDPRGLRDNGGPTETVALVRGDLAIGDGLARLAKDQRGVTRSHDRHASIGAFAYQDKRSVQHS